MNLLKYRLDPLQTLVEMAFSLVIICSFHYLLMKSLINARLRGFHPP